MDPRVVRSGIIVAALLCAALFFVEAGVFTQGNFAFPLAARLFNGIAFIAIGLAVMWLRPRGAASFGFLSACLLVGIFSMTSVGLRGPSWFFQLHALAQSLVPAGFAHLALVFPTDRIGHRRRVALLFLYVPCLLLGLVYQQALQQPSAWGWLHLLAGAAIWIYGIALVGWVAYGLATATDLLVRRRSGVVAMGLLAGLVAPTVVWITSGLAGEPIPLDIVSLMAFLFPLSIGYAIVKEDVFEIDMALRRSLTYGIVVVVFATTYVGVVTVCSVFLPAEEILLNSKTSLALFNLMILFLIVRVRDAVQSGVDRIFFRTRYDIEAALSMLSQSLASARTIEEVIDQVRKVFARTIRPLPVALYRHEGGGRFRPAGRAGAGEDPLCFPPDLAERFARGEPILRHEWQDGTGRSLPLALRKREFELLVPIRANESPIGLLALGRRASGHPYSTDDLAFLRTAANQIVLAMTNAAAFDQLGRLNESLEQQVEKRTAEFNASNEELNQSLGKLNEAYHQLEQTHETLLSADRLATLGRLTAGLAHEMNTPLSAVLNTLRIIKELGGEYANAIDDGEVLPADHHEIASEIISNAQAAAEWANKAATYIRSVKSHGREGRTGTKERFRVHDAFTNTHGLVAHRLRAASCEVDFREKPDGVSLTGDPGKLGQVLVNLITNAIDAYEEGGIAKGRIEIDASCARDSEVVTVPTKDKGVGTYPSKVRALRLREFASITVRDRAGGIPADILPHIFDELYTTKGVGRGTGLGLWISRNLIEEGFGGTLTVAVDGEGTCFTIRIPLAIGHDAQPPERPQSPAPGIFPQAVNA